MCYPHPNINIMKSRFLKRFDDEIQRLDHELKHELPKEIQRAREWGDLRENAEYQAAKERQRLVEARLSMLRTRAAEISLMNLDKLPHDRAAFGSTVHLQQPEGEPIVYQLVMPEDADPAVGGSRPPPRSAAPSSVRKSVTRSRCRPRAACVNSRSSSS